MKQEFEDSGGRAEPAVKAARLAERVPSEEEMRTRSQLEAIQVQRGLDRQSARRVEAPAAAAAAAAAQAEALAWQRNWSEKYRGGCEGEKAAAERAQLLLANAEAQRATHEEMVHAEHVRAAREKRREEKKAERAAAMAALEQQEEEIRKQRARLMGLEERSAAKHENFLQRSDEISQKLRQQLDKAQNAELPQGPASMGHPMPAQAAPTYDTGAVVPGGLAMPTGAPQHGHVEMQPPAYKTAGLAIPTAAPKDVEMQPPPNRSGLAMPTGAQEHVEMQPPPSRAGLAMRTGAPEYGCVEMQPPLGYKPAGLATATGDPEQDHVPPHENTFFTAAGSHVMPARAAEQGYVQPPRPGAPEGPAMPTGAPEQGHASAKGTETPVPVFVPDPSQQAAANEGVPMPSQAPPGQTWQAHDGQTWQFRAAVPSPPPGLAPQVPLRSLHSQTWLASQHARPPHLDHVLPPGAAPQPCQSLPGHGNTAEQQQTEKTRAALAAASMEATSTEAYSGDGLGRAEPSKPESSMEVCEKQKLQNAEDRRRLEEALQQLAALRASNQNLSEQLAQQRVPKQPEEALLTPPSPALATATTVPKAVAATQPMGPPSPQAPPPAPTCKMPPWTPGPVQSGLWLESPVKAGPLLRPDSGASTPTSDMEMGCTAKGMPPCPPPGLSPSPPPGQATPMTPKMPAPVTPQNAQVVPQMPPTP